MQHELVGEYAVTFKSQTVGTLTVSVSGLMTRFSCTCSVSTTEILRLAIRTGERHIPLGVLLPEGNVLRLDKSLSKHTLHQKGLTTIDACTLITPPELSLDPPVGARIARPQTEPPQPNPKPESTSTPKFLPKPTPLTPVGTTAPGRPPTPATPEPEPIPAPSPESRPEPPPEPAPSVPEPEPPTPPVGDATPSVPPRTPSTPQPIVEPEPTREPPLEPTPPPEPLPDLAPSPEWEFTQNWTPAKDEHTGEIIHTFPAPAPPVIPPPYTDADLDDVHPYPQAEVPWTPHPNPGVLFTDPELNKIEIDGARTRACGDACIELAVPLTEGEPFPLMQVFSHGEVEVIEGKAYLVFRIKDGNPVKH